MLDPIADGVLQKSIFPFLHPLEICGVVEFQGNAVKGKVTHTKSGHVSIGKVGVDEMLAMCLFKEASQMSMDKL